MKAAPMPNFPEYEYDRNSPPHEGQPVEFLISGRYVSLLGWYGLLTFHSRWAEYPSECVERWRPQFERMDFAAPEQAQTCAGVLTSSSKSVNAMVEN